MNRPQKLTAALLAFGVMSLGIAGAIELKQRATIDVRYEDGMMPVDETYARSYTNPQYHVVTVKCPMAEKMTAVIDIQVATYEGRPVSQDVIDEIQEFACEAINENPQVNWDHLRYEETK